VGQNYRESATISLEKQENGINSLPSGTEKTDRVGRNTFVKSALTTQGKDRLLLNYDLTQNNNNSTT
jgi:hypothetical protein